MKTTIFPIVLLALTAPLAGAQTRAPSPSPAATSPTPAPTPFVDLNPYQSQAWFRQANGMIKTFSAAPGPEAFLFEHPNALPAEIIATGSNFGIFKSKTGMVIGVADSRGQWYQYDLFPEPEANSAGGVYYLKKGSRNVVLVDSTGAVMETTIVAPAINLKGGNFYQAADGTLTTIKSSGVAPWNWSGMITVKTGFKVPMGLLAGGNFFVDVDGKITTVASATGFFSDPIALPDNDSVKVYGGNYLITAQNKLYTIDQAGALNFARKLAELPVTRGYSYMTFKDSRLLFIKGDGSVFDHVTQVAMSGRPVSVSLLDSSAILPTSVAKIGGVK
jgi:hypothetical protein